MDAWSKHVLVLRFSAMGDVALLTPVVKSFLAAYPNHKLTVVSRPKFSAFFNEKENLNFFPADVDSKYTGLIGIIKLYIQLYKLKPSIVIDLHDNLRSRIICLLFKVRGVRAVKFKKGRKEKKFLSRKRSKIREELPHTVYRYKEAFTRAGIGFSIVAPPYLESEIICEEKVDRWLEEKKISKAEKWIGLAPFAAHKTKIWPLENYPLLIESSLKKSNSIFFLFGGGKQEIDFLKKLSGRFPGNCILVAGELDISEELSLIKRLDKMICVDSGNMHLASLAGTRVLSIWGGTHPSTGFGPFGNKQNRIIQVETEKLSCRPCSVYGKEKCWRGDYACLHDISIDDVLTSL